MKRQHIVILSLVLSYNETWGVQVGHTHHCHDDDAHQDSIQVLDEIDGGKINLLVLVPEIILLHWHCPIDPITLSAHEKGRKERKRDGKTRNTGDRLAHQCCIIITVIALCPSHCHCCHIADELAVPVVVA